MEENIKDNGEERGYAAERKRRFTELLSYFRKISSDIISDQLLRDKLNKSISDKISEMQYYIPVVAIFGQTGAGKSSLMNAIFGKDVSFVSHVAAGTRKAEPRTHELDGGAKITVIDFPGIGETKERDEEYYAMYNEWIKKIDAIIWVVKADTRASRSDLDFWEKNVKEEFDTRKVVLAVTQCAKLSPMRDWDEEYNRPGVRQMVSVNEKLHLTANAFGLSLDHVFPVSVEENYNVEKLCAALVSVTDAAHRLALAETFRESIRLSQEVKTSVRKGIWETIKAIFSFLGPKVIDIMQPVIEQKITDFVTSKWSLKAEKSESSGQSKAT